MRTVAETSVFIRYARRSGQIRSVPNLSTGSPITRKPAPLFPAAVAVAK